MRTLIAWVGLLCSHAGAASLEQLVGAERAFDAASAEQGIRAAFLAFLAEDSILLRPQPVYGRSTIEQEPASDENLRWYPSHAEISTGGDLGYTTGPYRFTPADGETAHGHYVTVWREGRAGALRVVLDGGIPHQAPAMEPPPFDPAGRGPAAGSGPPAERTELIVADQAYSEAIATHGHASSARHWVATDVRLYRSGEPPYLGSDAVTAALGGSPGFAMFDRRGGGVSRDQDLGYAYGLARRPGAAQMSDAWLRIWRREGGQWRVALEMLLPLAPE